MTLEKKSGEAVKPASVYLAGERGSLNNFLDA